MTRSDQILCAWPAWATRLQDPTRSRYEVELRTDGPRRMVAVEDRLRQFLDRHHVTYPLTAQQVRAYAADLDVRVTWITAEQTEQAQDRFSAHLNDHGCAARGGFAYCQEAMRLFELLEPSGRVILGWPPRPRERSPRQENRASVVRSAGPVAVR